MAEPLTMFVIVRRDLVKQLNWNFGSVMTQACHATSAALWRYRDLKEVQEYTQDIDNMHKVVLETKNETSLLKVTEGLKAQSIPHYLWIEQPENIPTCVATAPVQRSQIRDIVKRCQLWR